MDCIGRLREFNKAAYGKFLAHERETLIYLRPSCHRGLRSRGAFSDTTATPSNAVTPLLHRELCSLQTMLLPCFFSICWFCL